MPSSYLSIDPKVAPSVAGISAIADYEVAILEQILNTTLIELEAQEKERLQDLSKEELIEQILRAKVSHPANSSVPSLLIESVI